VAQSKSIGGNVMFGFSISDKKWKKQFGKGREAGSRGDLESAVSHFKRATEIAPDEPYTHYELGYTLSKLGQYSNALREFEQTEKLTRGFFIVQTEIYIHQELLNKHIDESVIGRLRQIQQLADTHGSQNPEIVSLSNDVIDKAPEFPLGYYYLGQALFPGERKRSEDAFKICLDLSPDETTSIYALNFLALLRELDGDIETARKIWVDLLAKYDGNPHTEMIKMTFEQRGFVKE
jgi:tetratricopeptide (TPR) repeat protein